MCTSTKFYADVEKGKIKETIFKNWCDKNNQAYIEKVDEHLGYDFLVGKAENKLDVKSCSYKDGALVVEDISSIRDSNIGWWRKDAEWYTFISSVPQMQGYMVMTLNKVWIKDYMDKYGLNAINRRQIGNGYGWYIKINDNNKYNRGKLSIGEFVTSNYKIKEDSFIKYVTYDGDYIVA